MDKKIIIQKENPFSEVAKELLDELTTDIATRYNFLMDGKGGFSPKEVDNDQSAFLVAFFENEPVGCGALRPFFENEIAEVKRMYVRQGFRGRGISKKILQNLESYALNMGFSKIWLETGDRQTEALQLYQTSGYTKIGNYGIYKENMHSNCFEKKLKND